RRGRRRVAGRAGDGRPGQVDPGGGDGRGGKGGRGRQGRGLHHRAGGRAGGADGRDAVVVRRAGHRGRVRVIRVVADRGRRVQRRVGHVVGRALDLVGRGVRHGVPGEVDLGRRNRDGSDAGRRRHERRDAHDRTGYGTARRVDGRDAVLVGRVVRKSLAGVRRARLRGERRPGAAAVGGDFDLVAGGAGHGG